MGANDLVRIGRSDIHISRLGLGTGPLGGLFEEVSTERAVQTVLRAYDRGIRHFDTAPLYGFGLAEKRLGKALQQIPRESVTVATKVGRLLRVLGEDEESQADVDRVHLADAVPIFKGVGSERPVWDFSYDAVRRSLEESLERLGVDRVDLALVHDPEDHMQPAVADAARALIDLREEGVVGAVGVGTNHAWVGAQFVESTDVDFLLVAGRCTLLDRSATTELLPMCTQKGVSVIAAGVFNSGILAEPDENPMFWYEAAPESAVARARQLRGICARYDVPLKAAALQFPFRLESIAAVVVGARSPEEVDDDVEMLNVVIPEELWRELGDANEEEGAPS